jgi:hypothetical protein
MFTNQCLNLGIQCGFCPSIQQHLNALVTNPLINYPKMAEQCLEQYYTTFDNNILGLAQLFTEKTKFTFQNHEFNSFYHLLVQIRNSGVSSFTHRNIKYNAQPLDCDSMIITVNGELITNLDFFYRCFTETIIIRRNPQNGKFYIMNVMFKFLN